MLTELDELVIQQFKKQCDEKIDFVSDLERVSYYQGAEMMYRWLKNMGVSFCAKE